jgi:hypothetical protein
VGEVEEWSGGFEAEVKVSMIGEISRGKDELPE